VPDDALTTRTRRTHVDQERPAEPARDAAHPPDAAGGPQPDTEHRPLGALAVVGFLTLTIMVFWFGMYALNVVRN